MLASDNYHVIFVGPGVRDCRGRLRSALGYVAGRRRAAERTVTIDPHGLPLGRVRRGRTWCPGRYTGRVEVRRPERDPAIPFEQLGRFAFEVRR